MRRREKALKNGIIGATGGKGKRGTLPLPISLKRENLRRVGTGRGRNSLSFKSLRERGEENDHRTRDGFTEEKRRIEMKG